MNNRYVLLSALIILFVGDLCAVVIPPTQKRVWENVICDLEIDTSILSKVCVIDSKVDTIMFSDSKICVVDSKVDVITELDETILSKVCVIDSKEDAILSILDNVDFDGSVMDEVLHKVCTIQSVVEVIDPRTITIESAVDIIEDLDRTILSKVCVIDSKVSELNDSKLCVIESKVDDIDSKIDKIIADLRCTPTVVTTADTIASPGTYCLANDILGVLTIDSPRVVFDLNGHQISGGISLTGSASEIFIMNGFIDGGGVTIGVDISAAAVSDIHIINVTILDATVGISATVPVSRLFISDTIVNGSVGNNLSLTGCDNVVIEDSVFNASATAAGGLITGCTEVEIRSCFFNSNTTFVGLFFTGGSSNALVIGSSFDANTFGVAVIGGTCHQWIECRAEANTSFGFIPLGTDMVCEGCFACGNGTAGFLTTGLATNISIDRCISKSNATDGFTLGAGATGILKENIAMGNVTCGFNDLVGAATGIAYLANTAQGNAGGVGAGNYCIAGVAVALGTPPFAQVAPPGVSFWNNISV